MCHKALCHMVRVQYCGGETVVLSSAGGCGAQGLSWLAKLFLAIFFFYKGKVFYVGTVVIVETGVMSGMQLSVKSNASAVKTVETGLR